MVQVKVADLLRIEQVSHSCIQHFSEFKLTGLFQIGQLCRSKPTSNEITCSESSLSGSAEPISGRPFRSRLISGFGPFRTVVGIANAEPAKRQIRHLNIRADLGRPFYPSANSHERDWTIARNAAQ
jgi:hypothetical protein